MADLVATYGAVLNSTASGDRTTNAAAIAAAITAGDANPTFGTGTLYLPTNANLDIPYWMTIEGVGSATGQSCISAQGTIIKINQTASTEFRQPVKNLMLTNETGGTFGKLVWINQTYNLGGLKFHNVNFQQAETHVYCSGSDASGNGFIVEPEFFSCKFEGATARSVYMGAVTGLKMMQCKFASNKIHMRLGDDSIYDATSHASRGYCDGIWLDQTTFEGSQNQGIHIVTQQNDTYSVNINNCWFEGNGTAAGTYPDILLVCDGSGRFIDNVTITGGNFGPPSAAQVTGAATRVSYSETNSGVFGQLIGSGVEVQGSLAFANNTAKVFNNKLKLRGNSAGGNWKTATYA